MKETYQVLVDESQFNLFVDSMLPDLESWETYYFCLFARTKYCKDAGLAHIKSDKQQLKRGTTNKERLRQKIQQMECVVGSYAQRDIPIPQQALACYINVNPRCLKKATQQSLIKLAETSYQQFNGMNPHQEVISCIQKSCSRKIFLDFDFDVEEDEIQTTIEQLDKFINLDATSIIRTRGGFHYLIEVSKIDVSVKNKFYKNVLSVPGCDVRGDNMIPIPGTYQGGFVPFIMRLRGVEQ